MNTNYKLVHHSKAVQELTVILTSCPYEKLESSKGFFQCPISGGWFAYRYDQTYMSQPTVAYGPHLGDAWMKISDNRNTFEIPALLGNLAAAVYKSLKHEEDMGSPPPYPLPYTTGLHVDYETKVFVAWDNTTAQCLSINTNSLEAALLYVMGYQRHTICTTLNQGAYPTKLPDSFKHEWYEEQQRTLEYLTQNPDEQLYG
jgi:hypothetical protein